MNFSVYTKETFTPKLVELYNQKWKSEKKSQKDFAKEMNALYEKYDIRDRSGEEYRTCTHQQVSQWLNGTFPDDENLRCICEVLGVDPEHFTSPTEKELYKFSQHFMTKIGETRLLPYCEEVGLDPQFLVTVGNLLGEGFGDQFPFWAPIGMNAKTLFRSEDRRLYDRPDPLKFWSDSAEMKPDVKMFQIEVKEEGSDKKKLLTLTDPDLRFLKDVQDEVINYVGYLFHKRKDELRSEAEEASRRSVSHEDGKEVHRKLKADELNEIDRYYKGYIDKDQSKSEQ